MRILLIFLNLIISWRLFIVKTLLDYFQVEWREGEIRDMVFFSISDWDGCCWLPPRQLWYCQG